MAIRTFADDLRERSDEELTTLFTLRPDLLSPIPSDISAVAARALSIPSITRALDSLTKFELDIFFAASALDEPINPSQLISLTDKSSQAVLEKIWSMALIYQDGTKYRIPIPVRTALPDEPHGLGPKAVIKSEYELLAKAPKESLAILDRLTWGTPRGQVSNIKSPGPALGWLIDNDFLAVIDSHTVALPRELSIHLRGNKIFKTLNNIPPIPSEKIENQVEIDNHAIANITDLLRWIEELAQAWADDAPHHLKTGGVGIRDIKNTAEHLGISEFLLSFLAEISFQSDLIGVSSAGEILPTQKFDLWSTFDPEEKWSLLVNAWVRSVRAIGLIGKSESRMVAPLSSDLDRPQLSSIRKMLFEMLLTYSDLKWSAEEILQHMEWSAPRKYSSEFIEWTLREMEIFGITGGGQLSSFGRTYLQQLLPEVSSPVEQSTKKPVKKKAAASTAKEKAKDKKSTELGINQAFPEPVDYILLQSDNSAIAPGPLTRELSDLLGIVADIESRGGATVFRFNEQSIRRALDHGKSGDEILEFLSKRSKTPLPQPLEYLIKDTSKRHGKIRVGTAHTYIRSEDEATMNEILHNKNLLFLQCQKIAPTVLITQIEPDEVMNALRENNYLPARENQSGLLVSSPRSRRLTGRSLFTARSQSAYTQEAFRTFDNEEVDGELNSIDRAIRILRTTAKARAVAPHDLPRTTANETLALLQECIEEGATVIVGYADTNGGVSERIVDPISVSQGTLSARDHANGREEKFRIPRITGVIRYTD